MAVLAVCLSPGFQRSVLLDRLHLGEVNRISHIHLDVSGKGVNVCRVLHRLGIGAVCVGQGGDNAAELSAMAMAEGFRLHLTGGTGRLRTCTSIIETAPGGRRVTELVEPSPPVDDAGVAAVRAAVAEGLGKASVLVVSGSMAPGFPAGFQAELVDMARRAGVPAFVDLQGQPLRDCLAAGAALAKINLSEFAATFLGPEWQGGEHRGPLADETPGPGLLDAVAGAATGYSGVFILTRGARSVITVHRGRLGQVAVQALEESEMVSPIGSGDAFMAGLVAKLLSRGVIRDIGTLDSANLEAAVLFASACARSNARTARPGFLDESFPTAL
jgi:fructose-1-phosphate kinase PfkB-like protein